jgi:hypothetical protein
MRIAALALALAACGGGDDGARERAAPVVEDPGPVHVHGLGINPKDGALFIATHTGLFRAPPGEPTAARVAGRYQDTMGFTVVGPDRFLGSGHPDARERLPPFLGLIESRDAGRTWDEVSLMGEADFHVLEAARERVYAFGADYDSRRAQFLVSDDGGRTWDRRRVPEPLLSLAVAPTDRATIVAAGERRLHRSEDAGRSWRRAGGGPGLLAWSARGLFRVDAAGRVHLSRDGGRSWSPRGDGGDAPAAFEAAAGDLYLALHDGVVKRSSDGGRTWAVRSRPAS